MKEMNGTLTRHDMDLACKCLEMARRLGSQKVRITLNKSLMELFGTLNGELDKVSHCLDRSMTVCLFVDGKYGSFSTNMLVESSLDSFLAKSVSTVRMLTKDACRDLPDPKRTAKDARDGNELMLHDPAYAGLTSGQRLKMAMDASIFARHREEGLISEEGEYSDSIYDTLVLDSNGTFCRHTETSFEYGVEATVQDASGNRFSSYWWDAAPRLADLQTGSCAETAFRRATAQIGPRQIESGKYTMVVDAENASKLVTPLLNALGACSLQQKNSFLLDTLGKEVFPQWLDIRDMPRSVGETGSRLFDSEGVATCEHPIIEKGQVKEYFINTYMSRKMNMEPTTEDATRPAVLPCLSPWMESRTAGVSAESMGKDEIMALVGDGILVTGFNGGNTNSATGDFSFGIEGFAFKDGRIAHPIREVLITGNLLKLWNNLIAAGADARRCRARLIPSLAFRDVDFSA